ncbi:hypothetical protein [Inquilinus limosus]|uniref:hypothetical protein n=1 Tax=Inquilinus limosus TaxID=171674 RepID=UPI0015C64C7A|nr:hypothetical protein [Inquilinus limosus]
MVDPVTAETPPAASPAAEEAAREVEVLAALTQLALEMARAIQAQGLAALAAGDLDRAGRAESRFSSLFLGIRRAVALRARLHRQQGEVSAVPAAGEAAMLSELMERALELARGFQALGVTAGDLDRAGEAETRFSSLFLGIRRAIALQAKLRQQREDARRKAEQRRKSRQDETDDRRQAVAQGVARAIAAVPDADDRDRLTVDLWERLTEDERIDADLADTALPIGGLIASLCRALGLPPGGTPPAGGPAAGRPAVGGPAVGGPAVGGPATGDPAAAKAGADEVGAGPKGQAREPASAQSALRRGRCIRAPSGWRTSRPSAGSSGSSQWRRPPRGPPTGHGPR